MALRDIIILPNKILKRRSEPITVFDDDIRKLADDMFDTMYHAPGIGLAAVQVGVLKRMIVIDVSREDDSKNPICLINPEIMWSSQDIAEYEEGCLSIPDTYDLVTRPTGIKVRYLDRNGAECELEAQGLLSTCIQHEIDHLDGVVFIDHVSRLKRDRIIKKFAKAAKQQGVTA